MAKITFEKIKEMFNDIRREERVARYVVTVTDDGNWHTNYKRLTDDAWDAFLFSLENDGTICRLSTIDDNVVLIKRKAKKALEEATS